MSIEKLTGEAVKKGVGTLALTDINNTTGVMDFVRSCRQKDIRPVAGIDFCENGKHLYTCIALNNKGFRELNEFLSASKRNKTPLPDNAPPFDHAYTVYPFGTKNSSRLLDNEFTGIGPGQVHRLVSPGNKNVFSRTVILHPVTFAGKEERMVHRHLRAIDRNVLLSRLEPGDLAGEDEIMKTPGELRKIFGQYPEIIDNTEKMADECSIGFDFEEPKNKKTFTGSRYDDKMLLEKLALDGLTYRYGKHNTEAERRVRHELEIIDKLGFCSYFLIAWDIIRYSLNRGFYHVGRGSGANSVVAYCLKITDVDPIELNLYFERFINPRRTTPPDFDIDYSWKERDEVIGYIFRRYGTKHTALLGTITTFRDRSIFRELGKVYGLPKEEVDVLVRTPGDRANLDRITGQIFRTGHRIMDFPNGRSIHAGGVLISEEPVTAYTALDMPPRGFPTTQWDMYVAESIGFEKLDILSQRGIGHIRESVDIVLKNKGHRVDIHDIHKFKQDPDTLRQLRNASTTGCFYIESPAMRGLLRKLHCSHYPDLVAASSIIRPGVARSGMMREYIRRFHNPGGFEYIHPVMKEQLGETYGVMVYQEDVIRICHHFAGLDLADADVLRRAMSGKFRSGSELERIAGKFFSNCRERGYPEEIIKEVWRQIESFSGYSFSKAHSASYAVESFQSLFLKAHYPLEFMVAVINNFGGFYRTWVYINEVRKQGAVIHLPCVNKSDYMTGIRGRDIYLGFVHVNGLESRIGNAIPGERERNGEFRSLENFVRRVPAGLEQVIILIRTGAFRFTGKSKKTLLWEVHMMSGENAGDHLTGDLFPVAGRKFVLPELKQGRIEHAYDEIEFLGFPVTLSPFDLLKTSFRGEIKVREMIRYKGKRVRMTGNLVCIKNVKTIQHEWMHFGTFLDAWGDFFDTVHFPASLRNYPFKGYGIYLLLGRIDEEYGFPGLVVEKMARLPVRDDPRYRE